MFAIISNGTRVIKQQSGIIGIACVKSNNYSTEKVFNLASLKRGTGGRSSFNGIVCTVFGCTGFTGKYVINRLAKIGTQIILPYRCTSFDVRHLKVPGDLGQILFHSFDPRDEQSIVKAMKYSNVVINLIGRDWETSNYKFDDVHVKIPRQIARIAKNLGVERLIHVSALNATERPTPIWLKTGSKFLASKFRGEQAVLNEFPEATIIRPADIYGQEDRFLRYYIHLWRRQGGLMPLWMKGERTIKQPIHIADFAAGVVATVRDPDTACKIYQAVGPKRYKLSELVDWFYRITKREDYIRYDMRYDPFFQLRVSFNQKIRVGSPIGNLHWERIERECISDTVDSSIPTMEDLGLSLMEMENQIPWELKPWTRGLYYGWDADEPEEPILPPKVVA